MRVKGVLLPPFFSALDQTLRCDVRVVLLGSTYNSTAIVLYVFTNVLPMHVFLLYFVLKYLVNVSVYKYSTLEKANCCVRVA